MRTESTDCFILNHCYFITHLYYIKPVRNDKNCLVLTQVGNCLVDLRLILRVCSTGRFIQNQNRRIFQDSTALGSSAAVGSSRMKISPP